MRVSGIAVALLALAAALPAAAQAPGGTYTGISSGPAGAAVNGTVYAVAVAQDGSLYVGGDFTTAGDVSALGVARWDGTKWRALGSGVVGTSPDGYTGVRALAFGLDGALYAGGYFTTAGGTPANRIARWDGTSWSALGTGVVGTTRSVVHALTTGPSGDVYVGGAFLTAGGVVANGVARWDGQAWHALGGGVDGEVRALAVGAGGGLFAAGAFSTAGGVSAAGIAEWDGTDWSALGTGLSNVAYTLAASSDGSLYVGGVFTEAGDVTANHAARWDGTAWHSLGTGSGNGLDRGVYALTVEPTGDVYAGGYFLTAGDSTANRIARWDGAEWSPLARGVDGDVRALTRGPGGGVYAGGAFSTADGLPANRIARWDGTGWQGFGSAADRMVRAVVAGSAGTLYAGGDFGTAGGVTASSVAQWTGTGWRALGGGLTSTQALALGPDGSLYAGGHFSMAGGSPAMQVARWDGAAWRALGDGVSGPSGGVFGLALGPDGSLYAAGSFTMAGGIPARGVARWDGATWHAMGTGALTGIDGVVRALAVGSDGSVYAGGSFYSADGVVARHVARWDGAAWHALGSGIGGPLGEGYVYDLTLGADGSLYVGGYFAEAGGVPARSIARWDGANWHALGFGIEPFPTGEVYALATGPDGSIYVGGTFTYAGGTAARRLARWDGEAWGPLGDGVEGTYASVQALTVASDGRVFIGGAFGQAGTVVSPNLVRYTPITVSEEPATGPEATLGLAVSPNPTRGTATATITHPAGSVTVEVVDVLGRRVAVATEGDAPAGRREVALGLDGLAPGVYVVRLVAGREALTRTLVVVR